MLLQVRMPLRCMILYIHFPQANHLSLIIIQIYRCIREIQIIWKMPLMLTMQLSFWLVIVRSPEVTRDSF